ncbi:MAG: ATP-binding protein [Gammaproteobacteria bacterium]|nr:ATP-binding protein [Gammaproteobacteria bacterium]
MNPAVNIPRGLFALLLLTTAITKLLDMPGFYKHPAQTAGLKNQAKLKTMRPAENPAHTPASSGMIRRARSIPSRLAFIALIVFGLIAQIAGGAAAPHDAQEIVFTSWLFHAGDNPQWRKPGIDETGWHPIEVPGNWQAQGLGSASGLGWYRAHVNLDGQDYGGDLGVSLGRIFDADQAFFNGVPIGSEGKIGAQMIAAQDKTRTYLIPPEAIRAGDGNVLAVRVKNIHPAAGIVSGPIGLGSYSMLSMEADGIDSSVKVFQGMIIGLFLVLILFSIFLYLNGLRDKTNVYFGLFLIVITAATFLDSLYLYDLGLKTALVQRMVYALQCAAPIVLLLFVATVIGGRVTTSEKAGMLITALLACLSLISPIRFELLTRPLALEQVDLVRANAWGTLAIGVMIAARGLLSALRGFKGGLTIAIAASLPLLGGLLSQYSRLLAGGVDPILIGIVLMILLFLFAVAGRFFDLTQRLQGLTRHLTNVQAMERERLSRELHDSLGQTLVSFQLNLKLAGEQVKHPLLTNMLAEVSASIRRLDDTLQGLRPTELKHADLCAVIERQCRRIQEAAEIKIDVHARCARPMSEDLKENLFRIFQEALNNCIKHAHARHVTVSLSQTRDQVELRIVDDGTGFDPKSVQSDGLGMLTMRERAHLLGARLAVESPPGAGTTVRVEAPLND